jgi:hypothetical protein
MGAPVHWVHKIVAGILRVFSVLLSLFKKLTVTGTEQQNQDNVWEYIPDHDDGDTASNVNNNEDPQAATTGGCLHRNVTTKGTNGVIIMTTCKDCGLVTKTRKQRPTTKTTDSGTVTSTTTTLTDRRRSATVTVHVQY